MGCHSAVAGVGGGALEDTVDALPLGMRAIDGADAMAGGVKHIRTTRDIKRRNAKVMNQQVRRRPMEFDAWQPMFSRVASRAWQSPTA